MAEFEIGMKVRRTNRSHLTEGTVLGVAGDWLWVDHGCGPLTALAGDYEPAIPTTIPVMLEVAEVERAATERRFYPDKFIEGCQVALAKHREGSHE